MWELGISNTINRRKFIGHAASTMLITTLIKMDNAPAANPLTPKNTIRPSSNEDIAFLSLHEQAQLIRAKKLSSLELVTIYFKRIKSIEAKNKLNCFINLNEDDAFKKAKELDNLTAKNKWSGRLHGTLISIKDDLEVELLPMTAGSKLLEKWIPQKDAFSVTQLKNDGALISGKTNLDEFTFGALGQNFYFGNVKNPYNLKHSSGGSSAGSAASVAAGLSSASIGSDAAGSIRVPAASCGVYGFKPTLGMISRSGLTPFIPTKDAVGCIARSPIDIQLLFQCMQGYDINDELTSLAPKNVNSKEKLSNIKNLKIGVLSNILKPMSPELALSFENTISTLKSLHFQTQDVQIKNLEQIYEVGRIINFVEQRTSIELLLKKVRPEYSFEDAIKQAQPHIQKRLAISEKMSSAKYCSAVTYQRNEIQKIVRKLFEDVDLIVLPTLGGPPPLSEMLEVKSNTQSFEIEMYKYPCELAGLLGLPAITIPQSIGTNGLPIGFQIIGKPYKDNQLIELSIFLENKIGRFIRPTTLVI